MRWLSVVSFLLATSCANKGDPSAPRGLAQSITAAMDRGDVDLGLRLLAPEDRLRASFDCGPSDRLARATLRSREELRLAYEELKATGVRVRLGAFEETGAEEQHLAPGDAWRDCVAKVALDVYKARATLVYRKGARDDEDIQRWDFVRFAAGEPWWFVPR